MLFAALRGSGPGSGGYDGIESSVSGAAGAALLAGILPAGSICEERSPQGLVARPLFAIAASLRVSASHADAVAQDVHELGTLSDMDDGVIHISAAVNVSFAPIGISGSSTRAGTRCIVCRSTCPCCLHACADTSRARISESEVTSGRCASSMASMIGERSAIIGCARSALPTRVWCQCVPV